MTTYYSPGCNGDFAHVCDMCEMDDGRATLYWSTKGFDLCHDCIDSLSSNLSPELIPTRKAIKEDLRNEIFERDGYVCRLCGSGERLTIDHIKPFSKGGKTENNNLQTLCFACNLEKRAQWTIPGNVSQR